MATTATKRKPAKAKFTKKAAKSTARRKSAATRTKR